VASSRVGGRVATLTKERGIDVVHLHGAFNTTNTRISRSLLPPFVFSPHSGYNPVSLRRSRGRKVVYRRLFERAMLDRASLLVALTETELADLRRFGASGVAEVIPNGVERPPDDLDRDVFRRELGISPNDLLAVFVGRLDVYRKGLDVLVRGIASAPRWHLAVVGPAFRDVDRLERLISDLRVRDRIHLVGERHGRSLHESLAGADVFTMLSRWEGLPMALLEALSHSVPTVVSRPVDRTVGVAAAGAGWVTDEDGLEHLLHRLAGADRAELLGRRDAALLLSKRYAWDEVARRYEEAYERVIGSMRRVTS
jgi:glycosyltransferase involved in cell wall biosynthesis